MPTIGASPTGEHLYRTACLRPDIAPCWTPRGFTPGQRVHVRYWKHEYCAYSHQYRPLFLIGETENIDQHIADGEFSCVFNAALQEFKS